MKLNYLVGAAIAASLMVATAHAQVTIYSSSFEGTNGGFVPGGAGDWQRGMPMSYIPAGGTNGAGGIPNAATGTELWATILNGPHNNQNPGASSTLMQTFDFSGFTTITLSFQHYLQSGGNTFDMAAVFANGIQVMLFSGTEGSYSAATNTVTFALAVVDLSAFAGQSNVQLNFDFFATTVVQRDGWYIDDVLITGNPVPEPATLSLLVLAGGSFVVLAVRRRRGTRASV